MRKPAGLLEDQTLIGPSTGDNADAIVVTTLGKLAAGFAARSYDGISAMYVEITRLPNTAEDDMIAIRVRMWGTK
jgi:hypothetical protein